MILSKDIQNGIFIIKIEGSLALDYVYDVKSYYSQVLIDHCPKGIIIDCSLLEAIDSNGISFLISAFKELKSKQLPYVITRLNRHHFEILERLNLDKILKILKTNEAAIAYCNQ